MGGGMNGRADREVDGWIDGSVGKQKVGWVDGWMRKNGGWENR